MRSSAIAAAVVLLSCGQLVGVDEFGVDPGATPQSGGTGPTASSTGSDVGGSLSAGGAGGSAAGGSGGVGGGQGGRGGQGGQGGMVASGYRQAVIDDGPVGYWRLGEASGTTAFDEAGNNDCSYEGGFTLLAQGLLTGDGDTAASFAGNSSDRAGCPDVFNFTGNVSFTVEAWVLPDNSDFGRIVAKRPSDDSSGWQVFVNNNGTYFERYCGLTCKQTHYLAGALSTSAPSHVVVRYDSSGGTEACIFVNNAPICTPMPNQINPGNGVLRLGHSFAGVVDEVAIYDKPLSDARIDVHYQIGIGAL